MSKYKAKEVKELSEYVKANKKRIKTRHEEIQAAKTVTDKIKTVGEIIIGPKRKPAERMAIFDPVIDELITDENKILAKILNAVKDDVNQLSLTIPGMMRRAPALFLNTVQETASISISATITIKGCDCTLKKEKHKYVPPHK